jgi:hypothetical protein
VLGQGGIGVLRHLIAQGGGLVRPDDRPPPGAGLGRQAAGLLALLSPATDRARPDAEEAGGLGLTEAGVDGTQQPLAEVDRILLHPQSLTSSQLNCNPLKANHSRIFASQPQSFLRLQPQDCSQGGGEGVGVVRHHLMPCAWNDPGLDRGIEGLCQWRG